jgi:hypothetical protein
MHLGRRIVRIDPQQHVAIDDQGTHTGLSERSSPPAGDRAGSASAATR